MPVTIYHNPACGTSRNTLAMIRQSGEEPEIVEYLKTPPSRERLVELLTAMGMKPSALLRQKGTPYTELGLGEGVWTDDELIEFMIAHPILIERPIVVTGKGVRLSGLRKSSSKSCLIVRSGSSSKRTAKWSTAGNLEVYAEGVQGIQPGQRDSVFATASPAPQLFDGLRSPRGSKETCARGFSG